MEPTLKSRNKYQIFHIPKFRRLTGAYYVCGEYCFFFRDFRVGPEVKKVSVTEKQSLKYALYFM